METASLHWEDWLVMAIHIGLTIAMGVWVGQFVQKRTQTRLESKLMRPASSSENNEAYEAPSVLLSSSEAGAVDDNGGSEESDQILAGRSMSGLWVALSLISGLTSGISFLGCPGYIFNDGVGFIFVSLGTLVAAPLGAYVLIPFFRSLQLVTAYSYFELRFTWKLRAAASCFFLFRVLFYCAIVLYAPALMLQTVLGFPLPATILFTTVVSTMWTVKGGMFAVVFTDAMQSIAMILCVIFTTYYACKSVGGFSEMWHVLSLPNNRSQSPDGWLQFRELLNLDPTNQSAPAESYWAFLIGVGFLNVGQMATDQLAVQRFMSTKNMKECIRSWWNTNIYLFLFQTATAVEGLAILAYYTKAGTNPVADGSIETADQILPYFSLTMMPHGMTGLLVAAVLGSTMSVYSGGLNAAATAIHVDLLPIWKQYCASREAEAAGASMTYSMAPPSYRNTSALSDAAKAWRLKKLTLCLAAVTLAFSFVASQFKGVVVLSNLVMGMCLGPIMGVFFMGILTERGTTRGAGIGFIIGTCVMLYYGISQVVCPAGGGRRW